MVTSVQRRDPILITGCPRSGTKYIATLLGELGLDVRHEEMGRDGISSWFMSVSAANAPYGPARNGQHFHVILHQVRNPLDVIPSMSTLSKEAWEFAFAHIPCCMEDPLWIRCATLWVHWNLHAQRLAEWRYRVEELPDVYPVFCQKVGVAANRSALARVAPNVNTRAFTGLARACKYFYAKLNVEPPAYLRNRFTDRHIYQKEHTFTWESLRKLDGKLCEQAIAMAREYGYGDTELRLGTSVRREAILSA